MGWGNVSVINRFRRISSYTAALNKYISTPHMRGKPGVFPIDPHRTQSNTYYMKKLADESIAFYCYNTECVTWHPDNTVTIRTGGYNTNTTSKFIWALSGVSVSYITGLNCTDTYASPNYEAKPIRFDKKLTVKWDKNVFKVVEGELPSREWVIDKEKSKAARKVIADVRAWFKGVTAIGLGYLDVFPHDTNAYGVRGIGKYRKAYQSLDEIKTDIENPEMMPTVVYSLADGNILKHTWKTGYSLAPERANHHLLANIYKFAGAIVPKEYDEPRWPKNCSYI